MIKVIETHRQAVIAIAQIKNYFSSLRKWIGALDSAFMDQDWTPAEPNAVSDALGNGYLDTKSEWVLTWVWRHYFQPNKDQTILMILDFVQKQPEPSFSPVAVFARIQHKGFDPSGEPKDRSKTVASYLWETWKNDTTILSSKALECPRTEMDVRATEKEPNFFFREATALKFIGIPLEDFGDSPETVKTAVLEILEKLKPF